MCTHRNIHSHVISQRHLSQTKYTQELNLGHGLLLCNHGKTPTTSNEGNRDKIIKLRSNSRWLLGVRCTAGSQTLPYLLDSVGSFPLPQQWQSASLYPGGVSKTQKTRFACVRWKPWLSTLNIQAGLPSSPCLWVPPRSYGHPCIFQIKVL